MPTDDQPIDDERFDAIFDHALDLPEKDRANYLTEACQGDEALRRQLEDLLASESHRHGREFMDDPTVGNANEALPADAFIGTNIGPYKILQALGEGGYGVVYLAEQRRPVKRRVALKVIKLGMDTKQVIARFEAERQALAMMEHSNIAKVFDAGATDSGRPYFVMELVRGVPITEYCDQCRLSMEKRLALFIDVCHAVQHAHQKGVIHRDLKPNNILVTLHDGVPVAKVIDFGIAKATNIQLTDKTLFTDFRQFIGTPAYTSPEQAEMSGLGVDTRSDIYSLGVLLYELLTGTTPVSVETLKQAAYADIQRTIRETDPPTPSNRLSTLSNVRLLEVATARAEAPNKLRRFLRGELDWILMKALEKDRERRYDTANAFAKDVQGFLDGEPVSAGAPSPLYRLRRYVHRHKAAVAVMLALLIGGVVSAWQAVRASRGELEARRNLYIADMSVAQDALNTGSMERAITTLERHVPKRGERDLRHWEWRYLWDQTQRDVFTLLADDDPNDDEDPDALFDLSLSSDGQFMASAAINGRIRVWGLETLSEKFQFQIPAGMLAWTDFSPSGRYLVAGGQDWKPELARDTDQPSAASADADAPRSKVSVWDVVSEQELKAFELGSSTFACSPRFVSETLVCAGGSEGHLWFCEMDSGNAQAVKGHDLPIEWVAVAGNSVVTAAADGVNLWDASSRTVVSSLTFDEPRWFTMAEISPDARRIAVINIHELAVTVHDASTWEVIEVVHADFDVYAVRFNYEGTLLAVCEGNGTIRLFETETWKEQGRYHLRSHQVNDCALSNDGSLVISGGENGVITAWPGKISTRGVMQSSGDLITVLRYSPDGRFLASGSGSGRVELWAAEREVKLLELPAQREESAVPPDFRVDFYDFSPDSERLAVAYQDKGTFSVDVWDLVTLERIDQFPHPVRVNAVAYSPDGRLLATGCRDHEGIRVWNLQERKLIARLDEGKSVHCLAFSPDSHTLASKGWDNEGTIVWEVATGKRLAVLDEHVEPFGNTSSLLFSPDGQWLATAGYDSQVILWDTDSWKPAKRLLGHTWIVGDLAFTPDGKRLASSGPENWCLIWDVDSGRELVRFPGLTLDFSPDGHALAVGGTYLPPGGLRTESPDESTIRIHRAPSFTGEED